MDTAYAGATWWLEVRRMAVNDAAVTGDSTPTPTVAYALTLDGVAAGAGALAWDADRRAWRTSITLPTPTGATGILKIAYTGTQSGVVGLAHDALKVRRAL